MRNPELARLGIGGSDIAAIFGQDEYRDAFAVWADKKGNLPRREPDPMMIVGKALEVGVAELYQHVTGKKVQWLDVTQTHPERPWMLYTPDALVVGERRGLDCKVVHWTQRRKWGADVSEIPARVVMQAWWYMAALDFDLWDIAAFKGDMPAIYTVERNRGAEAAMLDGAWQFFRKFIQGNETPPIGGPAAQAWLKQTFPIPRADLREADIEEIRIMQEYAAVRERQQECYRERAKLEAELKLRTADHEGIYWEGGKFTWKKRRDSKFIDWKSMAIALRDEKFQTDREREEYTRTWYERTRPGVRTIRFEWDGFEAGEETNGNE